MANPRYYPPPERKTGMAKKLERLGALTALDGPQQDPQTSALRMLGLFQEMQNAKAQQEYHTEALKEQRLNREGDERARTAAGGQQKIAALLDADRSGVPGAREALAKLMPELGVEQKAMHAAGVAKKSAAIEPAVRGAYAKPGSDLPQRLGLMEQGTDPEVWAGLPWDELNAGLQQPAPSAPSDFIGSLLGQPTQPPQTAGQELAQGAGEMGNVVGNALLEKLGVLASPITFPIRQVAAGLRTPVGQSVQKIPFAPIPGNFWDFQQPKKPIK